MAFGSAPFEQRLNNPRPPHPPRTVIVPEAPQFEREYVPVEDDSGVFRTKRPVVAKKPAEPVPTVRVERGADGHQRLYDERVVARYEELHRDLVQTDLAAEVRLSALGVPASEWAKCKQRPNEIGLERRFSERFGDDANRRFSVLAEAYQRLVAQTEEDEMAYGAACIRLGVIPDARKGQSKREKPTPPREQYRTVEAELRKLALHVAFEQTMEKKEYSLAEAIELHKGVVLQLMNLPPERSGEDGSTPAESLAEHKLRLTIRSLVRVVEQQLDLVRVKEQSRLAGFGEEIVLGRQVGRADEAALLRQELDRQLTRLAPLYFVDQASRSPERIELRAQYHEAHGHHALLQRWYGRPDATAEQRSRVELAQTQAIAARERGYPQGFALVDVPVEAYAAGR